MGRSPPTEERAGSYPSLTADVTWRLQQLVAGWQGAERNQPVSELHNECLNAAGPGGRHLLPAILLLVKDLDETHLQADLARKLEWLEAGDLLRIQWAPDVVVLRLAGHDDEVQREEERLVDPQALKALRGVLGESYRQSLQAILSEKADGLTFVQVVQTLRERQGHDVPRSTVRAILYAGGFVHRNGRWFAAPQSEHGARKLRAALAETLVPVQEIEQNQTVNAELSADTERLKRSVQAIRAGLAELVNMLRESL